MTSRVSCANEDPIRRLQKKYTTTVTALNGVILLIGLVVLGIGVFVNVGGKAVGSTLDFVLDWISRQLQATRLDDIDTSNFDLVGLLQELSAPLIVLGIYFCCFSVCGLFAAKKKNTILIIMYSILVGLGLLMQAGAVFIIFSQRKLLDVILKESLLTGLQQNYRGYNETNLLSQTWNIVMVTLHCCGINDYRDFKEATQWRRKLFQDGWWFNLETPVTCCNMERKDPGDFACAVNPIDYTSNYKQGCYEAAWTLFDSYRGFPLAAIIILMTIQFVPLVASILLARELSKKSNKDSKGTGDFQSEQVYASSDSNEEHIESGTVANNSQNRRLGGGAYQTGDERNFDTTTASILNTLPFTGLGAYLSGAKRDSFGPDLLSQFLSGPNQYNRMSNEFGFLQGRMPSFDLGVSQSRIPFDYGMPQNRIPSADKGFSQGPIILQLQQQPNQRAGIMAITEFPDEECTDSAVKQETNETDIAEKKSSESKVSLQSIGRCKSENCLHTKTKNQSKSESKKPELSRRKTLPKVSESKEEAYEITGNEN